MYKRFSCIIPVFLSMGVLFFTGNIKLYSQEKAVLFNCTPIGWSENSNFAYIVEEQIEPKTDDPVGTIPVIYYVVQNMITDRVLEKSIPSSDINSFYNALPEKIAEIKKKYSIKEINKENRFDIFLLKQNTYVLDEKSGQYILFEAERTDPVAGGSFSITATLQPDNKKKVLSYINAEALEIAGYVDSPFEKRIALCIVVYGSSTLRYDDSNSGKILNKLVFIGCHVEKFK